MSWKDIVIEHEKRIQDMAKALHCLKLEVRDLEKLTKPKPTEAVRCKDCKQWDAELGCCTSYTIVKCTDGREGVLSEADDFCSRGVMR